MKATQIPDKTREKLAERSGGMCEICGAARAVHAHHRRPRGMGGTRDASSHSLSALLHLCEAHHDQAESYRTESLEQKGWLVRQGTDPSTVSVQLWHGRWRLAADGSFMPVPYEEWRQHRGCDRKKAYASEMLARNWATANSWRGLDALVPYHCEFCGDWHLTSASVEVGQESKTTVDS